MTKKYAEQLVEIFSTVLLKHQRRRKIAALFSAVSAFANVTPKRSQPENWCGGDIPAKRVAYFKPGKELRN